MGFLIGFLEGFGQAFAIVLLLFVPLFVVGRVIIALADSAERRRRSLQLCVRCSYNLTATTSDACPRCGTAIQGAPRPGSGATSSNA